MKNGKKIGLSLSGGGYRATIYHLGTLRKLKELNLLRDVDVISSVSGGSITSAYYGLFGEDFNRFEKGIIDGVRSNIIIGVMITLRVLLPIIAILISVGVMIYFLFSSYAWVSFIMLIMLILIMLRFQFKLLPLSSFIEQIYDKNFFNGLFLENLTEKPTIAINSTNLETGRLFTFSKSKMSDSAYEYAQNGESIKFNCRKFPVSRAVAASTSVPFAFTPIAINKKYFVNPKQAKKVKPRLIDGGVYDNQGIHKITQPNSSYECDCIITSDAGFMLPYRNKYPNTFSLLIRTSDIFMSRIKNFQLIKNLYGASIPITKKIAYFSLGWNIENSIPEFIELIKKKKISNNVISAHGITQEMIKSGDWALIKQKLIKSVDYSKILSESPTKSELGIARSVKTSLVPLSSKQINALIKHAESICELHIKLYLPDLCISDSKN